MSATNLKGPKNFAGLILLVLFLGASIQFGRLSHRFYEGSVQLTVLKRDYAEINHIRYGIFNTGQWKARVTEIVSKQIDQFELSAKTRQQIRSYIMDYLTKFYNSQIKSGAFLDRFLGQYAQTRGEKKEINLFGFKLKLDIQDVIKKELSKELDQVDVQSTMRDITDQIMLELKRNEPVIREAIREQMYNYFQMDGMAGLATIQSPRLDAKYNCQGIEECAQRMRTQIEVLEEEEGGKKKQLVFFAFSILVLLFLANFVSDEYNLFRWVVIPGMTILSLLLLALGLSMPMIDLYASLEDVRISFLGTTMDFGEQVLFFQSKSILEVVDLLLSGKNWDGKMVGYLILAFSILFPILKTIATFLLCYMEGLSKSKLVKKLVFTLGKWSMADVFVVGLFMAYIGFNTLVQSQLLDLNNPSESFDIVTHNKTVLRPGALFFTAFVLVSLCLSSLIAWREDV